MGSAPSTQANTISIFSVWTIFNAFFPLSVIYISKLFFSSEKENEIEEYNTLYTKCYKDKNDVYTMYLYSSPIAYEENGKIIDIDNSIVRCSSFTYKYRNKKIIFKHYILIIWKAVLL